MMRRIGTSLLLMLTLLSTVAANDIEQRSRRGANGQWVRESSVEIAEYERDGFIEIDGEVFLGRSDNEGQVSYWIEIRHEVDFNRRGLSEQDMTSRALGLASISLNGVSILTTAENTEVFTRFESDEMTEIIRIDISRATLEQIVNARTWQGSLISNSMGNVNLWMKRQSKVQYQMQSLLQ
jgi:hypothetical protein